LLPLPGLSRRTEQVDQRYVKYCREGGATESVEATKPLGCVKQKNSRELRRSPSRQKNTLLLPQNNGRLLQPMEL